MSTTLPTDETLLDQRRIALSQHPTLMGLDYIIYSPNPQWLLLYFVAKTTSNAQVIPPGITPANIQITVQATGSTTTPFVINAVYYTYTPSLPANAIALDITGSTINDMDSTAYNLALINVPDLDPFFTQVEFSILENAQAPYDTYQTAAAPVVNTPSPEIDYLARDFLSFRQLMLDRLSVLIPDWDANNEADLGSVIVEILAYAGDFLSYYQDAVTTEAYLSTARLRVSVKRHTRLLDYILSEGCNARVWVHVNVSSQVTLDTETLMLTQATGQAPGPIPANSPAYQNLTTQSVQTFATLYPITLYPEHNVMPFYTWGSQQFSLAAGATSATLLGQFPNLQPGDVLVFEQVKGPDSGSTLDADPSQRFVVRLTGVALDSDPLGGRFLSPPTDEAVAITDITWNTQDALPDEVVITALVNGNPVTAISQVRGNMVLADNGQFITNDTLNPSPVPDQGTYRPSLTYPNLTFSTPFDPTAAAQQGASVITQQDPTAALPQVTLQNGNELWTPQVDLLSSNYLSQNFVVEMEDNGQAFIRFGDGTFGEAPTAGTIFTANYRIGNGTTGNIGANSLAYVVVDPALIGAVTGIYNPLSAQGGIDPEPIAQAVLYAPKAFQQQERCVTVADYVQVAEQYPGVNSAAGILRWTGSWNTVFLAIERPDAQALDTTFTQSLLSYLQQFQLLHHDLEIIAPQWVALEIVLPISILPGYLPNVVLQQLLQTFSSTALPDGSYGFFYPDNFSFGQTVYLSQIVSAAMEVPGVASVDITSASTVFQRVNDTSSSTPADQSIAIGQLEIAQVMNNPQAPEQGSIQFIIGD